MSVKRKLLKAIARTENPVIKGVVMKTASKGFLRFVYTLQQESLTQFYPTPCVFSLSFDIDYKKDVDALPYILKLLKKYNLSASFACIGKLVEKHPEGHKVLVDSGQEILNHSHTHPFHDELQPDKRFENLSEKELHDELKLCHDAIKKHLGVSPTGFRLPHFGNKELRLSLDFGKLYQNLEKLGYTFSSSKIGVKTQLYGAPYKEGSVWEFPLSGCPTHTFGVLDTYHSYRAENASHKKEGEFYKLCEQLIDIGAASQSYVNVYFDPQDVYQNKDFERFLELLSKRKNDVTVATYGDILKKIAASSDPLEHKIKERFNELSLVVLDELKQDDFRIQYIMNTVGSMKDKKVLDVGCGKGAMLRVFGSLGAKLYGIDPSEKILAIAKKEIKNATLKQGSATALPFEDNYFDVIVSSEVIEHVPDTQKALDEMVRVLKPGGRLVVIDKNKYALHYKVWFKLYLTYSKLRNPKQAGTTMYPKGFGFEEKWFSKKEIVDLLKKDCSDVTATSLSSLFIGWSAKKR